MNNLFLDRCLLVQRHKRIEGQIMLRRGPSFLAGFLLGGLFVFATLKYHIIRAEDGLHVIPKMRPVFRNVYVDIREFSLADWQQNPSLAMAIGYSGKTELLAASSSLALRQASRDFFDSLWNRPSASTD